MDVQAKLNEGRELHRQGRLGDAGRCYQAVLALEPDNPDALNLMSVLAQMSGDNALAATLAWQAIQAQPDWAAPYIAFGNACQSAGDVGRAADAFHKAIELSPEHPEAYINLASALNELGRHAEAVKYAVEAVVIDGSLPEAHTTFGNCLAGMDSPEEAIEAFQKAVYLRPDWDTPWFNIAAAQAALGRHDDAVASYEHAIALVDGPTKRYNLANSLAALGRFDDAVREFRQALAQAPGYVDAHNNLAATLKDMERLDEAEVVLRQALLLAPDSPDLHWNLALVLLMKGDWVDGWREYEWRWKMPTFLPFVRDFGVPEWDGGDVDGKTVLVSAEQGFGDALEFCRFIPLLAARGVKVALECRAGLKRLFATLAGVERVVSPGDDYGVFDLTVPLMSLPYRLGLTLAELPAGLPYLSVPAGTQSFADVAAAPGLKVGVVWAGGVSRRDNTQRSCRAADFAPLLAVPGCSFFSLQVGPMAGQIGDLPGVVDLAPRLGDFADTAAAIAELDLIVSVDTGVVHLAGALGKPVRVLLSKPSNGFLWMLDRDDSPWYPKLMTLRRQPVAGDWGSLLAAQAAELAQLVGGR